MVTGKCQFCGATNTPENRVVENYTYVGGWGYRKESICFDREACKGRLKQVGKIIEREVWLKPQLNNVEALNSPAPDEANGKLPPTHIEPDEIAEDRK